MSAFADLHRRGAPLLLPNAWDYASAAALFDAGFPVVGTTSLGVAAVHGLPDATGAARAETIALTELIAGLGMVTVDIESGFSSDPAQVAELAVRLSDAGAVGVNLEDAMMAPEILCGLIEAIKHSVPGLFVNARTDTYWLGDSSLDETLVRAESYVDAGADGIFVPGMTDPDEIATVVEQVDAPLNLLFLPGKHTVAELAALGVSRISTGSLLFRAAVHATVATALAVRDERPVAPGVPGYGDVVEMLGL
ncbi:isocitrate lyase/phosphoenolpyruvate mutase family protein [Allokutzneria sp. A3M-2-11 16]|uniref:isocitrate lyase/PEP mutase family protein n=1 Tax=Allokutzneria sp. A3M-2-11 16 TaxID=2962043 RepID=UPI0020B6DA42|nr:isocitrate lyase/phosphoenolpyruvate mutase family protein [Allokutzneria sp. A3M-2-11 16]MCP3805163.1 isocitrate lyase/phosphoenolpyruvate mutase family protein [Allokutzneria sp. A3M-2-11 16]